MKKNNIAVILVLGMLFVSIFSFTSFAIGSNQEDFLKFLIRKTYPELGLEGENKGLMRSALALFRRNNDTEITQTNDNGFVSIEVVDEENVETLSHDIEAVVSDDSKNTQQPAQTINAVVPPKIDIVKGKPQILIYHTHGTESYETSDDDPKRVGRYHSLNEKYNVMAVGSKLKKLLEERGYTVIHSKEYHDYPSFNGSYARSIKPASQILKENDTIKVVFDVHRDAISGVDESNRQAFKKQNTVKINGEDVAKFMIVVGGNTPNRKQVENFANYITMVANQKYPGIARPVRVNNTAKYNQYLSNNYALLEVGTFLNTIDEALRTTEYLAEIIDEVIKSTNR
ncbi:stage II sporulation protein P [Alkalithermobacter paradoxus]|uniref:Stage II sporulation protein SpoIIP n=1 Tax=Alkalithermobacter paradoxus TaxID=29349 RepID=A0A1V4I7S2_9FIRM|nr:stage II sporulation protein SpoIIP [[Clostridium] thermoalcaliphilum]